MTETGATHTGAHAARDEVDLRTPRPEDSSVGELLGNVTSDLSTLVRQELALAKAETKEEAVKAGKARSMLVGGGVAMHLAVVFLSLTAMWALGSAMALHWAELIVTAFWAVVGGILLAIGRSRLTQVTPVPERTVETLEEDAQWARTLKP